MNKGFIALTLVITIASLLIAFSYTQSIDTAHFFDMTRTKEYRLMNYYNAYSCIDQAILALAHDYFYDMPVPVRRTDFDCVIESIIKVDNIREIKVYGNYRNINVKRKARVKIYDDRLEVVLIE
ncbi:MAG: hypothetical protein Q7S72_02060 [Candidatus Taylorbacteria bacterium]|nr:hypothetical protein [Candidatus Taylorbacteria bacterium]